MSQSERILIVGAGALGSLLAAHLALAGQPTVLCGRPSPHLAAIQRHGLILETDRDRHTVPLATATIPIATSAGDLVVLLVKSWATTAALVPWRDLLDPATPILTLQNGLGHEAAIRAALGPDREVLIGVTAQAALRPSPGVVRHTGTGPTTVGWNQGGGSRRLTDLAASLTMASWPTEAVAAIEPWRWRKLAINAAINGLTALTARPNGAVATDSGLRTVAAEVAREVGRVARARGLPLTDDELIAVIEDVARATAANRSSMLRDLETGGQTEVDAIHGAVLAEADQFGIPVPVTRLLATLIRARETRAEGGTRA